MPNSPFHMVVEVVRDDGAFEAINERVVVLKTVGQLGKEVMFYAYGTGWPGRFKEGDQYVLVKREKDAG